MELKIHVNLQVHFWLDTLHGDAEFTTKKKGFDKYEAYLSTKLLKSAHISPFFAPTSTLDNLETGIGHIYHYFSLQAYEMWMLQSGTSLWKHPLTLCFLSTGILYNLFPQL